MSSRQRSLRGQRSSSSTCLGKSSSTCGLKVCKAGTENEHQCMHVCLQQLVPARADMARASVASGAILLGSSDVAGRLQHDLQQPNRLAACMLLTVTELHSKHGWCATKRPASGCVVKYGMVPCMRCAVEPNLVQSRRCSHSVDKMLLCCRATSYFANHFRQRRPALLMELTAHLQVGLQCITAECVVYVHACTLSTSSHAFQPCCAGTQVLADYML